MTDRRAMLVALVLLLTACGAAPTRLPDGSRPDGEAGAVGDIVLGLPTWAPESRRVHAPGPGWTARSLEFERYLAAARALARVPPESIERGYGAALDYAEKERFGLQVQYNLYVLNRLLFALPETEPLDRHHSFITEPGVRLPPPTVAYVQWPVKTDLNGHIEGIASPMSFVISAYDATGEFQHFLAHYPRRGSDQLTNR